MLLHILVLAFTVLGLSWVVPGFHIRTAGTAIAVAIVFSVLNFLLGWLIHLMLIVPAILTLGLLFAIVPFLVNTVLLWLTDKLMGSFEIESTFGLLLSAAVITIVNAAFYGPMFHAVMHGNYHYEQPRLI